MKEAFGKDGRPRVLYLMRLAHHALTRAIERMAVGQGDVTGVQLGAIFYLSTEGPSLMKDIADGLALNNSAVTGLMDRMQAQGLITREVSKQDARAVEVTLTAAGRKVAGAAIPAIRSLNMAALEGFSKADQQVIARFLIAMTERFGQRKSQPSHHSKGRTSS